MRSAILDTLKDGKSINNESYSRLDNAYFVFTVHGLREEHRGTSEPVQVQWNKNSNDKVAVMTNDAAPEREQIGTLEFIRDPLYPYPFKVAVAPHYWMTEQTGVLADAMEAYYHGEMPTPTHREALKTYLRQFVERAILLPGTKREPLLADIGTLRTQREFERFADELAAIGIEAF